MTRAERRRAARSLRTRSVSRGPDLSIGKHRRSRQFADRRRTANEIEVAARTDLVFRPMRPMRPSRLAIVRLLVAMSGALLGACAHPLAGVPDVRTPLPTVRAMLELARVNPVDVVYDLGSGDGRI